MPNQRSKPYKPSYKSDYSYNNNYTYDNLYELYPYNYQNYDYFT